MPPTAAPTVPATTSADAPLSPAARRRLVEAPFHSLGVFRCTTSYPHAGTLISREASQTDDEFRRKLERGDTLRAYTTDDAAALFGEY